LYAVDTTTTTTSTIFYHQSIDDDDDADAAAAAAVVDVIAPPEEWHIENEAIHTISGVLKLWLRELPDPLLTFHFYPQIVSIQRMETSLHVCVLVVWFGEVR
jgi:hypothetical protein